MIPAGLKASSEWFPAKERSIAVGYFNVGSSIGGMIAPPLVVWAIVAHSWEMAFIITGVLSLIWAICWLLFYKHPKDQKKLSQEERRYILEGRKRSTRPLTPKNVRLADRAQPPVLGHRAAALSGGAGLGTFNAWIPLFMFKAYGFNLKEIAMFAWMPMLFADLGCIVGGYLPPLFQKYFKVNLIVSRKLVVTMGAVLMIGPGMIGLFTSPYAAIALLCVGGFAHQALSGALITLSSDVFGRNEVATANGLTGMAAWTASTLFALVVGAWRTLSASARCSPRCRSSIFSAPSSSGRCCKTARPPKRNRPRCSRLRRAADPVARPPRRAFCSSGSGAE